MLTRSLIIRLGLVVLGTLWAGILVVMGLRLALPAPPWPQPLTSPAVAGGITAVAAGEFVFLFVVADRVRPLPRRVVSDTLQMLIAAVFLLSSCWAAYLLFGGPR